ncbi:hypothetical protein D3C81_1203620 [compost metagenome]
MDFYDLMYLLGKEKRGNDMSDLVSDLDRERSKLNKLGQKSIEQLIPLFSNEELQVQSQRVDKLLMQLYQMKSTCRKS